MSNELQHLLGMTDEMWRAVRSRAETELLTVQQWFLVLVRDALTRTQLQVKENATSNVSSKTASTARRDDEPAHGYHGVYRYGKRWQARIQIDGKLTRLGVFDDPAEAARVYDAKCLEIGRTTTLNFPDLTPMVDYSDMNSGEGQTLYDNLYPPQRPVRTWDPETMTWTTKEDESK